MSPAASNPRAWSDAAHGAQERVNVGVQLPTVDGFGIGYHDIRPVAQLAEDVGLDSVWVGDHLTFNAPVVEAFIAAATAAAVTTRINIGFGVLIGALRQPVWLAKQLSSLQVTAGGRLELGIGVGGEFPGEWAAAGVPVRERGRRTDALLDVLPDLLTGKPTRLGDPWDVDVPALTPYGPLPRLWIGGRSTIALGRAARTGGGWMGVWQNAERVAEARSSLQSLDGPNASTPIGVEVLVHPAEDPVQANREMALFIEQIYGISYDKIRPWTFSGEQGIAEGVGGLIRAGASSIVLIPAVRDHLAYLPALGRIASQLRTVLQPT